MPFGGAAEEVLHPNVSRWPDPGEPTDYGSGDPVAGLLPCPSPSLAVGGIIWEGLLPGPSGHRATGLGESPTIPGR